jgi:hypothetical protein
MKKFTLILLAVILFIPISCVQKDEGIIMALALRDSLITDLKDELNAAQHDLQVEKEKIKILSCESGFRHDGVWGDDGKSYGMGQYQEGTFNHLKQLAGKPNLKWKNNKDQIWLLDWAIRNGFAKYWTCSTVHKNKMKQRS